MSIFFNKIKIFCRVIAPLPSGWGTGLENMKLHDMDFIYITFHGNELQWRGTYPSSYQNFKKWDFKRLHSKKPIFNGNSKYLNLLSGMTNQKRQGWLSKSKHVMCIWVFKFPLLYRGVTWEIDVKLSGLVGSSQPKIMTWGRWQRKKQRNYIRSNNWNCISEICFELLGDGFKTFR